MYVYEIRVPKDKDPDAFAEFMQDAYLPAIHKGPTRAGQVTELLLLRREATAAAHRFLWLVGWSGVPRQNAPQADDEAVHSKFSDTFGVTVKLLDAWEEVARWRP